MSNLAEDFLRFLFEKYQKTGKNSFVYDEYMEFRGNKDAIIELYNKGIIDMKNDILGTIIIHIPKN